MHITEKLTVFRYITALELHARVDSSVQNEKPVSYLNALNHQFQNFDS
jgi:hypothetical protein